MKHTPTTCILGLIGGLLLLAGQAHAALLAYEPFTNAPGTALIGSAGGVGFTNAWQANSSGGVATNTAFGLQYADQSGHVLQSSPGAGFFQGLTSANTSMQPNRQFSFTRATNGEAATTWISLLVVRQGPTNGAVPNPYPRGVNITFDYPTSSSGANQRVGIGNSSGAATNTLGLLSAGGNLRPSANPPYQYGGGYGSVPPLTNFVLLRIDHVAGTPLQANDNAYLWVNPTNLALEPALASATTNVLGLYDYSIGLVRVFVGGQDTANNRPYGELLVDEIRVGESFADVTPHASTATSPLVITNAFLVPGGIVLAGSGGENNGTYKVLTSTVATAPIANWPAIRTNAFDASGNFISTNPTTPGSVQQYFRLMQGGTLPAAPTITNQPTDRSVVIGQNAPFIVGANGDPTLLYQWYFNTNTPLAYGTSALLTVTNAQFTDEGTYSVVVANGLGSVTSVVARLTVTPVPLAPAITNQPQSLSVTQGNTANFSVTAGGTAPLRYQWYFNTNTALLNQTNATLARINVTSNDAGSYTVIITNTGGAVTSTPALLTVLIPPFIVTPPQSQTVNVSNNATFNVIAGGTAPLSYQWYFNTNTPLLNQTNTSLPLTNMQSSDAGTYSVRVANSVGSITSVVATLTVTVPSTNGNYYVAPTGNDANPGTFEAPFATLGKAQSVAQPGNIIYMRGGTYYPSATINITNSGNAANRIQLLAYPGESPYLNFTNQPYGDANRGIVFKTNAAYWNIKGLEIGYAGDNGIKVEGHHLRFEQCVFHHNGDTGLQIGFGHTDDNPDGQLAAYIEVVNCDSYANFDDGPTNGGNADGFAAKMHCGRNIVFTGCRAWGNSDDGWDLFETDYSVVISNCWTWKSGFLGQGNGNGFKLGGDGTGGNSMGTHYALNCVSFGHKVNGFTQNSHKDGLVVMSCLSFTNGSSGYNYFMEGSLNSGKQNVFKNNVGIRRNPASSSNNFIEDNGPIEQNNSWNLAVTANYADYGSVLEAAALAPRQADGSLPTGFARLVNGSDLIDQGVDIGLPFNGTAPDLGPYEY